jgi:hypothetical protein
MIQMIPALQNFLFSDARYFQLNVSNFPSKLIKPS